MKCRHTWHAISAVEKSRTATHAVMEYTHTCPACSFIKTTVREVRLNPPGYTHYQLVIRALRGLDREGMVLMSGTSPVTIDQLRITKK